MLRKNKENLPDTVKTGKKKKKVPLIIGGVVVAIIAVSFAASKMTPKALPQVPVSADGKGGYQRYCGESQDKDIFFARQCRYSPVSSQGGGSGEAGRLSGCF